MYTSYGVSNKKNVSGTVRWVSNDVNGYTWYVHIIREHIFISTDPIIIRLNPTYLEFVQLHIYIHTYLGRYLV